MRSREADAEFLKLLRYLAKALDRIVHAQEGLVEQGKYRRETMEEIARIDEELRRRDQTGL